MNDDDLRARLRRIDPMPADVPVEPVTTPSSRQRLETIMNIPVLDPQQQTPRRLSDPSPKRRRTLAAALGAAAAVAALAVGATVVFNAGDDGADEVASGPPLELSLGQGEAMASCMVFDPAVLADMSPAFAATATAVEGSTVTLAVDRWYAGETDADTVVLQAQPGMEALIAGFAFEVGQQYLITAAEGNVNYCGYSGPASPELTAAFDTAFGG